MEELTHNIDSNIGQYGFHYDEDSGKYSYTFDYWTDPRFGQYIMYYDIIASGAMRYNFEFRVDPKYGTYTFTYSPLEKLHIEEKEVLLKSSGASSTKLTDLGVNTLRRQSREVNAAIDSFTHFLDRLNKNISTKVIDNSTYTTSVMDSKEITIDEFISLLFYDSIVHNDIAIVDNEFAASNNPKNNTRIESSTKRVTFENGSIEDETSSSFSVSTADMLAKMQADEKLMGNMRRLVELEQDKLLNRTNYSLYMEEDMAARRQDFSTSIGADFGLNVVDRKIDVSKKQLELSSQVKNTGIDNIENTILLDKNAEGARKEFNIKSSTYEDMVEDVNERSIEVEKIDNMVDLSKYFKNTKIDNNTTEAGVKAGSIAILDDLKGLKKAPSGNRTVDNSLRMDKKGKSSEFDVGGFGVSKKHNQSKIDERVLATPQERKVKQEVEKRLDLHKRFWFLESLGEMDYKILPNVDYKYPPNIDVFKSNLPDKKYVYRYADKFKDLGNYRVRLYNEDLSIAAQHNVIFIQDYAAEINGIKLDIDVKEISEGEYNYEVEFSIESNVDLAYMVINQPEGFIGNEFVFVAAEKFLADNHPIPFGEDLGIREIPVSISIMVDFMNILLLLWSKRFMAFSGMTGTQAIEGINELVYEWLTLDTSLEQAAIEDYHRCYRWLRWESEKVYNKAKKDPNLKGNRWIEEVIFEMIDYLEMHHFNKTPEWEDVLRMDEQRDIFNDPGYDIPIVLDKFKGVRKRAMEKNKRYN